MVVWVVASKPTTVAARGTGRPVSIWHGPVWSDGGGEPAGGGSATGEGAAASAAGNVNGLADGTAPAIGAAGNAPIRFGTDRRGAAADCAAGDPVAATNRVRGVPNAITVIATRSASAPVQRCPGVRLASNHSRARTTAADRRCDCFAPLSFKGRAPSNVRVGPSAARRHASAVTGHTLRWWSVLGSTVCSRCSLASRSECSSRRS